ncbi:MAG: nucleotide-binding domain containing protein, partial [Cyanobacteria bacterium J06631_9]
FHMGAHYHRTRYSAIKTPRNLNQLLKLDSVAGVEVVIAQLKDAQLKEKSDQAYQHLLNNVMEQVTQIYAEGKTPVVYTSREELTFDTKAARLAFGEAVSALMVEIVRSLPDDLSFLISKGGITSNDTLSKALSLTAARLLGQVIPGVSVVTTPANHPQFSSLPVVLFPGNVGDDHALALAYQRLAVTNLT